MKARTDSTALYGRDFQEWSRDQARKLRDREPDGLDWDDLAEEVESLGRSDRRALGSALKVVLEHLIKWRHPEGKRSQGWSDPIEEHRDRIADFWPDAKP